MRTGWIFAAASFTAAVALLGASARAQNAIGDGTALDNSIQQGSGGVNQGAGDPLGSRINGNRIVTGNVTGSSFFRDEVGYRAEGEFTGASADDELFRFRAVSQPSGVPAITARSFGDRLAPTPYFRGISGVTAGDVRSPGPPAAVWRAWSAGSLFDSGIITAQPGDAVRSFQHGTLGFVQEGASLLEVTASPLFGISRRPIEGILRVEEMRLTPDVSLPEEITEMVPSEGYVSPVRWGVEPAADEMAAELLGFTPPLLAPSMELGLQMQPWNMPRIGAMPEEKVQQRVQQMEKSLFSPVEQMQLQPGEDVYIDLLRQMREQRDEPTQEEPAIERPQIDLAQPTPEQLDLAARMRIDALERMSRARAQEDLPVEGELPAPVENLIDTLDAQLPTVGTLAGSRQDIATRHMREAEAALKRGEYFDAERRYERVLQLRPNYPLARVGLVHAQLGAGLLRSAALNLRNLFAAHPELIAVRYEANLLPSTDRLQAVRKELDGVIERVDQQYPAILLAYIGFQSSNPQLVEYGLNLAQARDPSDPLIPLLRRIWLDEAAADQNGANQGGANAAPDPAPDAK